jgi:hypothetical protein
MTACHNANKPQPPKPKRLSRYREITDTSRAFCPDALDAVYGTSLVHIWLAHALVLSMLQHPTSAWRWGRFGVVHAAGNSELRRRRLHRVEIIRRACISGDCAPPTLAANELDS